MAENAYNAGTIFLQVVPVFKDLQREVRDEAEKWGKALGDESEKQGEKAGERAGKGLGKGLNKEAKKAGEEAAEEYQGAFQETFKSGLKRLERELKPLKLKTDSDDAIADLDRIRSKVKELSASKIDVDLDGKQAFAELLALRTALNALAKKAGKVEVGFNIDDGLKSIDSFIKQIEKKHAGVVVEADTKEAERQIGAFERKVRESAKRAAKDIGDSNSRMLSNLKSQLDEISDPEITPELNSARVMSEMRGLATKLQAVARDIEVDAEVKTNAAAALASLMPLMAAFEAIDGRKLNVDVDLDMGAAAAKMGILRTIMQGVAGDGQTAANAFRSFRAIILAVLILIPALIPVIAALGGGLMALIPILGAVGAGIAVMVAGFSGIGEAVKQMGEVQDNAAKDSVASAKRMRAAARSVEDAERSLARARQAAAQSNGDAARATARAQRDAARQIKDALDSQRDAEENLAKAQRDARRAQDDLRKARKQAQDELKEAADRRRQLAVDERQAVVDLFNATVRESSTRLDPGATNLEKEQASIELEQARIRLQNVRDERKVAAEEKKKTDRLGVRGTNAYQTAEDRVTAALERQREAQEAVGEAAARVREVRMQAAESVEDAVRNQRRTEVAGAQAVQDAQRNLIQAQEDYATALVETNEIGSESMRNLREAMDALGPAGQRFARFIFGLKDDALALRDAIQEAMLPGIQRGLQAIIDRYGPQFQAFATRMAGVVGSLFERMGTGMGKAPWDQFFATYATVAPGLLDQFGQTTGNWMGVFARLLTIAAPFAERLSRAMLNLSENALGFVQSAEGTKFWTDFLDYAFKVGPLVADFFWDLWMATVAIAKALAPFGEIILGMFDALFDFISKMDPKILTFIATALMAIATAAFITLGIVTLVLAGGAVFGTVFSGVVFVILAVIGAIVAAYVAFDDFRSLIDQYVLPSIKKLWEFAKIYWGLLWEIAKIVFKGIIFLVGLMLMWWVIQFKAMKWTWENVLRPVFNAIWQAMKFVWGIVSPILRLLWTVFKFTAQTIAWVWKNIWYPVFTMLAAVLWYTLKQVFRPVVDAIKIAWRGLSAGFDWVWKHGIKPIFEAFMWVVRDVRKNFRTYVDSIGSIWEGLKNKLATPVRFMIETVINKGIIDSFNFVAKKLGTPTMKHVPVPNFAEKKSSNSSPVRRGAGGRKTELATGGIVPGYTPGRDVVSVFSPKVGRVDLSGGEAVMRPEFTRAVSPEWVHYWNRIARSEGIEGVRRRMYGQAHAKGGIVWPVPGRRVSTYGGHDGVDINRGSGWTDFGDPIVSATSGRVAYVGSGRGYGQAVFINSPYGPLVYGHTSRTNVKANQMVKAGQLIGAVGNTGNSSAPHLHFGIPGGSFQQALSILQGSAPFSSSGGGLFGLFKGVLGKIFEAPGKWIREKVGNLVEKMGDKFGDNHLVKMLTAVPKKLIGGLVDKIKALFGGAEEGLGGSGPVLEQVKQAAAAYGWASGKQWSALNELIRRESGWDPNAANPSSAARGLFQKMTSVHGPLEKTPFGQAQWGLKYIADRYGTPAKALSFHDRNNYYADGGVVEGGSVPDNGTMMYDNGGYLPPGLTTVLNLTGKPEPVFTADQFAAMRGGDGGGFTYAPTFNQSDLTAADVAHDLEFTYRRLKRRGGRYAGQGS